MLVKFWDLDTRHCFKTLVNHRSEVNDLMLICNGTRLITGCHDNELRIFELIYRQGIENAEVNEKISREMIRNQKQQKLDYMEIRTEELQKMPENKIINPEFSSLMECQLIGSLVRESKDALSQLSTDCLGSLFGFHSGNEKHIEIYKINSEEEIRKKLSKRFKKQKRKLEVQQNGEHEGIHI